MAQYEVILYGKERGQRKVVQPTISRFPDHTVAVRFDGELGDVPDHVLIKVQGYEPDLLDILEGMQMALDRIFVSGIKMSLLLPYMPQARYDRFMMWNDAHMLKIFARKLNRLGFSEVMIADPHSSVTEALVDNAVVVEQHALVNRMQGQGLIDVSSFDYIVAPDMGAVKKAQKIADRFKKPLIVLNKVRDMATGEITGLEILGKMTFCEEDTFLIVDDLCDGGRTFIETAKCLKENGGGSVSLYVTHGVFSAGVKNLLDNGIDHLYCTNSFSGKEDDEYADRVTQLDIFHCFGK